MLAFVKFHKIEFEFDVQETIDLLKNMQENPQKYQELWELWDHFIDRYIKYSGEYPIDLGNGKGFTYDADENGNITATEWISKHYNDQKSDE